MDSERLLQRFLQYVQIDTTAVDDAGVYPSSSGQLELGKLLVAELKDMGIADVAQDDHGIVMATVPGNVADAPVVAFNAHLDTSPETTGKNVRPKVIRDFDGQDIVLSGDTSKIVTAATCAELPDAKGKTIITTDGTTLLGGDDKAGIAIMLELANHLLENQEIQRGDVRLLFTCDEEIGHGVDHVDLAAVNATVCYTFDGGGQNDVDGETFSADMAIVTVGGINIHPSIGKDRMVNSIRIASDFIAALPADVSPEHTEGREGFLHPYVLSGGVEKSVIKILLRDFDTAKLQEYATLLNQLSDQVSADHLGSTISVQIIKQYRNMAEGLKAEPRAVALAVAAHAALGRVAKQTIIRGGTDGSQLTEKGLPTPNLSSGQHNIHSPLEWACLDEMLAACEVGVELVKQWADAAP